jgi:hypothetical protein
MALVNVTRKTSTLQAYQLTSPDDMMAALKYIGAGNYTGSINANRVNGTLAWELWFSSPIQNTSQNAKIGDWIVIENNAVATAVPQANFANLYTTP